jgi:signal transduction histidine kinase
LALVAIGWLFFGETFGWFIPVPFTGGKWFYLIEVITILLIAAFAVNLLATNMRRNLEKARAEVALRKHMEMEVMQLNAGLEQRVEERTQELQETQEKLLRQEKLAVLGQMAGSVGHELRNPLGVISNSVYYLKMAQPEANEKIKKHLDLIEQQVHTSEKIIGDLLGFARNISVEQQELAVPELVRRVLERFPVPAGMGLTMELPEDLPHVVADPAQMEQVLGNLTTNACQAMQDGGILILSASLRKNEVAIAVKDSGTGITPENMQKLFEPLFTTKATGIGLGLAISKKLAEANGGRI